jgi:hypothetical protein
MSYGGRPTILVLGHHMGHHERERLVRDRDVARIKMLQIRTRTTVSEYANKRRLAKAECRKKSECSKKRI